MLQMLCVMKLHYSYTEELQLLPIGKKTTDVLSVQYIIFVAASSGVRSGC